MCIYNTSIKFDWEYTTTYMFNSVVLYLHVHDSATTPLFVSCNLYSVLLLFTCAWRYHLLPTRFALFDQVQAEHIKKNTCIYIQKYINSTHIMYWQLAKYKQSPPPLYTHSYVMFTLMHAPAFDAL